MSICLKRINAIFIKELQDIKTNANQLFLYIIPIALTFVYKKLIPSGEMPKGFALATGLLMLVIMAGLMIPAMMLAEEKEKKTLNVLMLSPATPFEVFAGKGLLTLLSTIAFMFVLMFIDGESWGFTVEIIICTVLASVFCILLGMLIGLLAPNQMATGAIGFPFLILLMMLPLFGIMGIKSMKAIATFIPTYYYLDILKSVMTEGKTLLDKPLSLSILAAGILVSFIALLLVYRRKGLVE